MTDPDDRPIHDPIDEQIDEEIEDLIGAYALDALDAKERARVEGYLATHPDARSEADRLGLAIDEVAASDDESSRPSVDLWDRIATSLPPRTERLPNSSSPVATPADELAHRRARRRPGRMAIAIMSAAAVVLVALLGVAAVRRTDQPASSVAARLEAEANQIADQPGSRSGTLTGADGISVRVVIDAEGRGFVLPSGLAPLSSDETYQIWSVDNGKPVSLGLLGADPAVAVVGASGNPDQLAITAEPAGGSTGPTSNPVAVGTLS